MNQVDIKVENESIAQIIKALQYAMGMISADDKTVKNIDKNQDGKINILDIIMMKNSLLENK